MRHIAQSLPKTQPTKHSSKHLTLVHECPEVSQRSHLSTQTLSVNYDYGKITQPMRTQYYHQDYKQTHQDSINKAKSTHRSQPIASERASTTSKKTQNKLQLYNEDQSLSFFNTYKPWNTTRQQILSQARNGVKPKKQLSRVVTIVLPGVDSRTRLITFPDIEPQCSKRRKI